jgi:hypothetical protein
MEGMVVVTVTQTVSFGWFTIIIVPVIVVVLLLAVGAAGKSMGGAIRMGHGILTSATMRRMGHGLLRLLTPIVTLLCVISGSVQLVHATDEVIWRDRWNRMGSLIQLGYMIGVDDLVHVLSAYKRFYAQFPRSGGFLANSLHRAHQCLNQMNFTTVQAELDFATAVIRKQTDPQINVASVIYRTLEIGSPCDSEGRVEDADMISGSAFMWKDRWDQDLSEHNRFLDGYVAGMLDLVRNLDNAGKTPVVLAQDVTAAAACDGKIGRGKNVSVGQVKRVILQAIQGPNHSDPVESMSQAVFEALRLCRTAPKEAR